MHLTGAKEHRIDAKMRLTLPADVSRAFDDKVCLVPIKDVLYGFTPEGHAAWVKQCFPDGYNPRSRDDVELRRMLNSATVTVDIDGAHRISLGKLPERVLAPLESERRVVVVGNDDHFELWTPEDWQTEQESVADRIDQALFDL